jgi:hypothetical protein
MISDRGLSVKVVGIGRLQAEKFTWSDPPPDARSFPLRFPAHPTFPLRIAEFLNEYYQHE